jgi:hypothetical protein
LQLNGGGGGTQTGPGAAGLNTATSGVEFTCLTTCTPQCCSQALPGAGRNGGMGGFYFPANSPNTVFVPGGRGWGRGGNTTNHMVAPITVQGGGGGGGWFGGGGGSYSQGASSSYCSGGGGGSSFVNASLGASWNGVIMPGAGPNANGTNGGVVLKACVAPSSSATATLAAGASPSNTATISASPTALPASPSAAPLSVLPLGSSLSTVLAPPGTLKAWLAPAGGCTVSAVLVGGGGAGGTYGASGHGAQFTVAFDLPDGAAIIAQTATGGRNVGIGAPTVASGGGGSGGGASALLWQAGGVIAVAGGGGSGADTGGGNAGAPGGFAATAADYTAVIRGGGGATQSGPGAAGLNAATSGNSFTCRAARTCEQAEPGVGRNGGRGGQNAVAGKPFVPGGWGWAMGGNNTISNSYTGGSGGGGWYGGGGGAYASSAANDYPAGGGGGSSWVNASASHSAPGLGPGSTGAGANGSITLISCVAFSPSASVTAAATPSVTAGASASTTATLSATATSTASATVAATTSPSISATMTLSGTPTMTSSLTPSQTATPTGTPSQTPSRYADLDSVSSAAAGSVVAPAVGGAVAALAVLGACAAVALLRERRKRFVAKARSRDATAAAVEKAVALAMRDNPLSASKSRLLTSSQRQVALAESSDPVARAMAAALSGGDAAARARAERLAAERTAAIAALAVIDVEAERLERDAKGNEVIIFPLKVMLCRLPSSKTVCQTRSLCAA